MSKLILLIIILLTLLSLLPLILHGSRFLEKIRKLDMFFLIPHWKMFTYETSGLSQFEYYIEYRDRLQDHAHTNWKKIVQPNAHWTKFIWNPPLSQQILIYQYSFSLISELTNFSPSTFDSEEMFHQLSKAILQEPKLSKASIQRQFRLVKNDMIQGGDSNLTFNIDSDYYDL